MISSYIVCVIVFMLQRQSLSWEGFTIFQQQEDFIWLWNQNIINAEDRMGFEQNSENRPSNKQPIYSLLQLLKLIFGEEPLVHVQNFGGW